MSRPRRKGAPHKGWKSAAQKQQQPAVVGVHSLASLIRDNHDQNNPITEYLDAADAVLAAFGRSEVDAAFLNLCDALGLQATPAAYLDAAAALEKLLCALSSQGRGGAPSHQRSQGE